MLTLPLATQGCSFVGLAVGASIPIHRDVPTTELAIPPGTAVDVDAVTRLGREEISGTSRGFDRGKLLVDSRYGLRTLPVDAISRVQVVDGSYWWPGLAMGLVVDAAVVAAAVTTFSRGLFAGGFSFGLAPLR